MINIMNCDCMTFMRGLPDKAYELAIVDPEYGIGYSELVAKKKESDGWKKRASNPWDNNPPDESYFKELMRISINQIIWGGNYFACLWPTRCFIVWDKVQRIDQADCEIAWTSFTKSARIFTYARGNESGFAPCLKGEAKLGANIHPTQKPIALYHWLLQNYAKQGDKILDTHGGSCSLAIACHDLGFDLDACEIDVDYYRDAVARYERHAAQAQLFNGDLGYTYTNGAENAQQAELPIEETNQ